MKKFFCFVLAAILVFSMCNFAVAAELSNDKSEAEYKLALQQACELFPEFASDIRSCSRHLNDPLPVPYGAGNKVKTFEETRAYSDNLLITYTQFSDGSSFISTSDYRRTLDMTDFETISSSLFHYTVDMTVYSTYDSTQKLSVKGIKYCVDTEWYDNILDRGTISSSSVSHSGHNSTNKDWDDDGKPAYASYYADLPDSRGVVLDLTIKFHLMDGTTYVTVNDKKLTS